MDQDQQLSTTWTVGPVGQGCKAEDINLEAMMTTTTILDLAPLGVQTQDARPSELFPQDPGTTGVSSNISHTVRDCKVSNAESVEMTAVV